MTGSCAVLLSEVSGLLISTSHRRHVARPSCVRHATVTGCLHEAPAALPPLSGSISGESFQERRLARRWAWYLVHIRNLVRHCRGWVLPTSGSNGRHAVRADERRQWRQTLQSAEVEIVELIAARNPAAMFRSVLQACLMAATRLVRLREALKHSVRSGGEISVPPNSTATAGLSASVGTTDTSRFR